MPAMLHGRCEDHLRDLAGASVDAIVTDPPAGISFMGQEWDSNKGGRDAWIVWLTQVMAECLRVLKPGGHALVWALPRTSHWTATAVEDAGFELRDVITHHFGSGFPKSLDVGKAIDKAVGAEREALPDPSAGRRNQTPRAMRPGGGRREASATVTAPATPEAQRWDGWGTALKPASEHWILARKPLVGTVAANVLEHGTGGLNIDGCRVEGAPRTTHVRGNVRTSNGQVGEFGMGLGERPGAFGRWPANVILSHAEECNGTCTSDCPISVMDQQSGERKAGGAVRGTEPSSPTNGIYGHFERVASRSSFEDTGGASRFFYVPKASKKDKGAENRHPTVKNTALMAYLCRLITPPGGIVLDPFMGSGSTGVAAVREGFGFIGIEQDDRHFATADERVEAARREVSASLDYGSAQHQGAY